MSAVTQTPRFILAPDVFDGERRLGPSLVSQADGRISGVEPAPGNLPENCLELAAGTLLAPGFIDIQVNGGGGAFLNDQPDVGGVATIAHAHRRFGTTGLLPTLITDTPAAMDALLSNAKLALDIPGVLGFHLEGPFINPVRKGIHPAEHIRAMQPEDIARLLRFADLGHSLVTLAPEMVAPEAITQLVAAGLTVAAGHTAAHGADMARAMELGVTGVTHLFNAMSQIGPREPGVVGTALADPRLFCGIICDGAHVAPVNLRAAFNACGRDRLMIITDAMPTSASDLQSFTIRGRVISLNDGVLTGSDGTLAGAHITMSESVKNAVHMMVAPLEDVLVMASRTPARFLGLGHELGMIRPGFRASLVALREADLAVVATAIDGQVETY